MLTVSLCVVAYNEAATIREILKDISNQNYNHAYMEVVLVNNASMDNTEEIMTEYANEPHDFKRVVVVSNTSTRQASGWNRAIRESREQVIIRVDAHAHIPVDFVKNNVKLLSEGEYVTGGPRPCILAQPSAWGRTLLMAENSMFGSSFAGFRRGSGRGKSSADKQYVKSLFHGAYRREVFERVGLFDETLGRTEDNEFHYRVRRAGYKLRFSPKIISYQHTRSSLKSMIKQKFSNGYWVGLTLGKCPGCLSAYHFVPFAFVLSIITLGIGRRLKNEKANSLWKLMWGLYALLAVAMAVMAVKEAKEQGEEFNCTSLALPGLFLILHVSYGLGTLVGILKMPSWLKGINK